MSPGIIPKRTQDLYSAATVSTVPSKRPAEIPAEQRSQRPRIANPRRQTTVLAPGRKPTPPYPSIIAPPPPSQSADRPELQVPAREPQHASDANLAIAGEYAEQTDGERPMTLEWWTTGTPSHAKVFAADQIGHLYVRFPVDFPPIDDFRPCRQSQTWPKILSLEFTGPAVPITELQRWIKKTKPATARFRPASGTDDQIFGLLVKLLRETHCVGCPCLRQDCPLTH
jgi:hypothetical protein